MKLMKYQIFVAALGVFVLVLVATSFYLVGSPITQQALNLDKERLSDFMNIKYQMEDYHRQNKKLPDALTELNGTTFFTDPETQKMYDYKKLPPGETNYQLCTTFSADSKDQKEDVSYIYPPTASSYQHKKGYDCITYRIFDYGQKGQPPEVMPTETISPTASPSAELTPTSSATASPTLSR